MRAKAYNEIYWELFANSSESLPNYWENPSGSKWAEENRSMPYSDYAKVRCFFKDRLLECCLLELMRSFKNVRLSSFLNFTISEHRAKIKLGQIRFKWVDLGEPLEHNTKGQKKDAKVFESWRLMTWWRCLASGQHFSKELSSANTLTKSHT